MIVDNECMVCKTVYSYDTEFSDDENKLSCVCGQTCCEIFNKGTDAIREYRQKQEYEKEQDAYQHQHEIDKNL